MPIIKLIKKSVRVLHGPNFLRSMYAFLLLTTLVLGQFIPLLNSTVYAASTSWDFSNSADYTFDSSKIEFSAGQVQLKVASDWYNSSWTRRKAVTINNTSNASTLTNYQVQITVTYDSDMQSDFDDLRFTDSDGTTLIDYWLESKTDSTTATFWVEVPSISASSNKTIYIYYGNSEVTSVSNGNNTFILFDDFDEYDYNEDVLSQISQTTLYSGSGSTDWLGRVALLDDALVSPK